VTEFRPDQIPFLNPFTLLFSWLAIHSLDRKRQKVHSS
jgi:hypothetical protein